MAGIGFMLAIIISHRKFIKEMKNLVLITKEGHIVIVKRNDTCKNVCKKERLTFISKQNDTTLRLTEKLKAMDKVVSIVEMFDKYGNMKIKTFYKKIYHFSNSKIEITV